MKEIMDAYNWACPEIPKKIYIKPRVQPSANFGGRDDQFGDVDEEPSLAEEMVKYETLFPGSKRKSNAVKPEEKSKDHDMLIIQAHRIEFLENEVRLHKDSLIAYQNRVSEYTSDYTKLEVDYLNSQGEIKRLESKLERMSGLEQYNLWLMQQHLNLKKELGK